MRLDLLLAREPFSDIFVDTLAEYLKNRLGWRGLITWRMGRTRAADLLVNDKLNLIFPAASSTATLRGLAAEYAFHPHPMRHFLQRGYVYYAVARSLRRLFACASITLTPRLDVASSWCILPGNHSIRIVDFASNQCIVLRKRGFNPALLEAIVWMHRDFPELPSPRLLEANLEEGWYREQRVVGLPLNRVTNSGKAHESLKIARQAMASLYQKTLQAIPLVAWVEERLHSISGAVASLPEIYEAEIREQIIDLSRNLANGLQQQLPTIGWITVPTVLTHGDFQPANILVPVGPAEEGVYLIDWEYVGRRCIWYDALVFELKSRSPRGLSVRVTEWLQDTERQWGSLKWCGEASPSWSSGSRIDAFLLDEVLVRLVNTMIPGLRQKDIGLLDFIDELKQLVERSVWDRFAAS